MLIALLPLLAPCSPPQADLDTDLLAGLSARSIGPAGMSGRVAAIDALASDPNVIYVGAATGGLWKTTSGGLSWKPLFDDQPVASIGAIAIAQARPDVVWVGTGEGNPRNSASVGNGVWRSLDGGATWKHVGLEGTERIARLIVHPDDPDTAWAAALGTSWGESERRGVFKTTDGGASWRKVLYVDGRTGAADLELSPDNPDELLAALWDHRREPHFFRSGGPGSGLWQSRDGGETWERRDAEDGLPEGELGRIGLAYARSEPGVVYALVEATKSALCRSDDGGATWRKVNQEPDVATRPFYYADIRVDPTDADRVIDLASVVRVSEDGGKSFRTLVPWALVHPDHHALWIHPANGDLMIDGNDGGVAITRDGGRTWRFVRNLPLAQFYHLAVDDARPYHVYGGMQDNGSWRGPSSVWENGGIRNHHWQEVGFGDGFATLPIPGSRTQGYAMSQGGYLSRWDRETGERKSIRPDGPPGVELRFNWNAGIAIDPFEPDTVYYGSQFVHRSTDRGDTWKIISPDLTSNNADWQRQRESGGLTPDVTAAENYTSILTLAPSPLRQGLLWVGSDDGRLHVTRDGGASWTRLDGRLPDVPADTWIPHVEASKHDAASAFVVLDDHRRANWTPYLLRTDDLGATWTSLVTPELAAASGYLHAIEQDPVEPKLLFLGAEFGLFVSLDGGGSWTQWDQGVPTVGVRALVVHPTAHDLVLGTHGRAAYVLDDLRPLRELAKAGLALLDEPLHLFGIAPAQQVRIRQTGESRFPGSEEFRGTNRPYGALIRFSLAGDDLPWADEKREKERKRARTAEAPSETEEADPKKPDEPRAVVEILDGAGAALRTLRPKVTRGVNRVAWNLRRRGFARPAGDDDEDEDESDPGQEPDGPEVLPGRYQVRVTYGEASSVTPLVVLADPRTPVADAERQANHAAQLRAGALQERLTEAVEAIQRTGLDLDRITAKADEAKARWAGPDEEHPQRALLDASRDLRKQLDALERELWTPPDTKGIVSRDRVLNLIGRASGALGSHWGAPTPPQLAALAEAEAKLADVLARLNELFATGLPALRAQVAAAGHELLPVPAPFEIP